MTNNGIEGPHGESVKRKCSTEKLTQKKPLSMERHFKVIPATNWQRRDTDKQTWPTGMLMTLVQRQRRHSGET